VPRPQGAAAAALIDELRDWVGSELSPIAKPDDIRLTDNLPKTRSGKIMRRLLRAIARGEEITQDMSTLENPGILDQLRGIDSSSGVATGAVAARKKAAKTPNKAPTARAKSRAKGGGTKVRAKVPVKRSKKTAPKRKTAARAKSVKSKRPKARGKK
jgi:hypothetical protein